VSGTVVLFGGSRSLAASWSPSVAAAVGAAVAAGWRVAVGCSAGADAAVLSACPVSALAGVFAAFGPGGSGAASCSSVAGVLAAATAGAPVAWWAGGGPAVPLRARLSRRSLAALRICSAAVFFQPGAGSLAVAGAAVAAGVPVWAVGLAGSAAPGAPRGCAGAWRGASLPWPVSCCLRWAVWAWSPSVAQPALF